MEFQVLQAFHMFSLKFFFYICYTSFRYYEIFFNQNKYCAKQLQHTKVRVFGIFGCIIASILLGSGTISAENFMYKNKHNDTRNGSLYKISIFNMPANIFNCGYTEFLIKIDLSAVLQFNDYSYTLYHNNIVE